MDLALGVVPHSDLLIPVICMWSRGFFASGQLLQPILKTWVPGDDAASAVARHFSASLAFEVKPDDHPMFGGNRAGVPGDTEMQAVLACALD